MQQIKFKMDSHFRGNDGGWEAVKKVFWWRKLALAAIRKARINPPLVLTPPSQLD